MSIPTVELINVEGQVTFTRGHGIDRVVNESRTWDGRIEGRFVKPISPRDAVGMRVVASDLNYAKRFLAQYGLTVRDGIVAEN